MSEENHDEAHGPEANSQPVNDESLKARSTILLVEDDKLIRDAFITILECSGYHTSAVGTPSEALAALDRDPTIAFMITDYVLPDMNGIALSCEALNRRPNLPIILATGHHLDRSKLPNAPIHVMIKPFRPHLLLATIEAALKKTQ